VSYETLEIVQLDNGDVVLRRSNEDKRVLLRLEFSDEIDQHLEGIKLEVAKAMIQSGAGAYADLTQSELDVDVDDNAHQAEPQQLPRVYH